MFQVSPKKSSVRECLFGCEGFFDACSEMERQGKFCSTDPTVSKRIV